MEDLDPQEGEEEPARNGPLGNEAQWRATSNPAYVWAELGRIYVQWAMACWSPDEQAPNAAGGASPPVPPVWCAEYLAAVGGQLHHMLNFRRVSWEEKGESRELSPTQAAEKLSRVFGFTRGSGRFNAFADFWSAARAAQVMETRQEAREAKLSRADQIALMRDAFGLDYPESVRRIVRDLHRRFEGVPKPPPKKRKPRRRSPSTSTRTARGG